MSLSTHWPSRLVKIWICPIFFFSRLLASLTACVASGSAGWGQRPAGIGRHGLAPLAA